MAGAATGALAIACFTDGTAFLAATGGDRTRANFWLTLLTTAAFAALLGTVFGAGIGLGARIGRGGVLRRVLGGIVFCVLPVVAIWWLERMAPQRATESQAHRMLRFLLTGWPIGALLIAVILPRRDGAGGRFTKTAAVLAVTAGAALAIADGRLWARTDGHLRGLAAVLVLTLGAFFGERMARRIGPIGARVIGFIAPAAAVVGLTLASIAHADLSRRFLQMIADGPSLFARAVTAPFGARPSDEPATLEVKSLVERLKKRPTLPSEEVGKLLPERARFNVVLITLDTVRADHVSHLGYARRTTPVIDRLAASGTTFTRAWTQYPSSRFAIAGVLTGRYATRTAPYAEDHPNDVRPGMRPPTSIAQTLAGHGFRTAAITALDRPLIDRLFDYFPNGFETFENAPADEIMGADAVTERAIARMKGFDGKRPFHLWLHYFDPHDPYVAHSSHAFGAAQMDRYDSEIAFADQEIGRFLAALEARSDWARTVVILHSDHGEEFFEHGGEHHGSSLFEEQIRVPLVVRVPGAPASVVDRPVEIASLKTTILDLLGIERPEDDDGQSLVPDLLGRPREGAPPIFAEIREGASLGVRADAVTDGTWKLIVDRRSGATSCYKLTTDPEETSDLGLTPEAKDRLQPWLQAFEIHCGQSSATDGLSFDGLADPKPENRRRAWAMLDAADALDRLDADDWKRLTTDADPELRRWVLEYLRRTRTPFAFDALVHVTNETRSIEERSLAIAALGVLGDRRAIWTFLDLPKDGPDAVVTTISRGILGDKKVADDLNSIFPSLNGDARLFAIGAASTLRIGPAAAVLGTYIEHEMLPDHIDPALIEIAARNDDPSVLLAYYARLTSSPSRPAIWRSVMDALARFSSNDAAPILRLALTSPNPAIRRRAESKLVADGVGWWKDQLTKYQDEIAMAETTAFVDKKEVEAAEALRSIALRARDAGIAEWGAAIRSWTLAMAANRKDIAARDAEFWSKRLSWPTFASAHFGRLMTIAADARPFEPRLTWIVYDDKVLAERRWVGAVSIDAKAGTLPGAWLTDPPMIRLGVTPRVEGGRAYETTRPVPVGGVIAGEPTQIGLCARLDALPPGAYDITVEIIADHRTVGESLRATIEIQR